jgi:hypothetical protein
LSFLLATLLTFVVVLTLILRNPFAHTVLARVAAKYLKNELRTEIRIDKFEIGPRKSISLRNLLILDHRNDTIVYAGNFYIRFQHLNPWSSDFEFNSIEIENALIKLIRHPGDQDMNFGFISDYLNKPKDSLSQEKPADSAKNLLFKTENLKLTDCRFVYRVEPDSVPLQAINFKDIALVVRNLESASIRVANDTINAQIQHLSASEKSGFEVNDLSCYFVFEPEKMEAGNLLVTTAFNHLDMDLRFRFDSISDFNDFIHKVRIEAELRYSEINLYDAGYFAPVLFEMDNQILVAGKISGTVENFKAADFDFSFGMDTHFSGNIQMNGLPDFDETFMHLTIKELTTTARDISQFRLPVKDSYISVPGILDTLGVIDIKGKFTGFYTDFVSYGIFDTDIGQLKTDVLLKLNPRNIIEYSGKVEATGFNAGKLLNPGLGIGSLDLKAEIKGQGVDFKTMKLNMEGTISSFGFRDVIYDEIRLSGTLKDKTIRGYCSIGDELVSLDLEGIFKPADSVPTYDFIATIRQARLDEMNMIDRDTSVNISANLNINITGNRFDNLQGILKLDNFRYSEKGNSFGIRDLTLSITRDGTRYTLVNLYSDFLDAAIEGQFLAEEIPDHFYYFINNYLDRLIPGLQIPQESLKPQDFTFDLVFKDSEKLTRTFMPRIAIAAGTRITGGFNSEIENLFFDAGSDEITLFGTKLTRWSAEFHIEKDKIMLDTRAGQLFLSDSMQVDSLSVLATAAKDTVIFSVNWVNDRWENSNYGNIHGYVVIDDSKRMRLKFDKGDISVNDSLWVIEPTSLLTIDSGSFQFDNITFSNGMQILSLDGHLSENPADTVVISFSKFNLSNTDKLLENSGIDLDGIIDGSFKASGLYKKPNFLADISVSDLCFNQEKLGEAVINSAWDSDNEAMNILCEIIYTGNIGKSKTLQATGTYFPYRKNRNFDINIHLSNYKIKTIEPFVKDFSSFVDGAVSGDLRLSGSASEPDITGEISLIRGKLKIDFLNVTYSLADKIFFDKNLIHFDHIIIYDSLGNQAEASGKIRHEHLRNFDLDLSFKTDKLAGLNTTRLQNQSFYGAALASGTVGIKGPPDNLMMDIKVASQKGTNIKIPVAFGAEVTENNYIIFTDDDSLSGSEADTVWRYDADLTGMTLSLDLNVTHDANIQMFLPYQMGNIQANGKGDIRMQIAPGGVFTMDGEYVIQMGSLFFTLQNILNRNFDISRGSKVSWTGDPYDATIDLKAVYKVKTTLGDFVSEQESSTPVQVDCIIALTKSLYNPDIRFSFEFPDLKEDTRQSVYTQLDTNDQTLMSQQMISLLLLNSFYHSSGTSGTVGFNTLSIVTNQLNSLLSKLSDDVNIGIKYRPGSELTSDEVEVALSTQLFDERVLIDGNLGVKSGSDKTGSNNLVGQFNVDVRITRDGRFRAKAFNKSNNNYLYKNYAPYTQGVGLFYTEDFNRFGDLFRKRDRSHRKISQTPPENQSMNEPDTIEK